MVWANIRANTETWLKKHPVLIDYLPDHQKILIEEGIKISRCQILERKEEHVLVEFGDKKDSWWLINDHWDGFKKF